MAKSRYSETEVLDDRFYASWTIPVQARGLRGNDLLVGLKTTEYVMRAGDRIDHLAAKFYNEDAYWWIIAIANDILWPLAIEPGTTLRIPLDPRDIFSKIFR